MKSRGNPALILAVTSFVVLFQELALIRWTSAQVRVLAYFPNVVLISAFLGLGIGSLLARRVRSPAGISQRGLDARNPMRSADVSSARGCVRS